MENAKDLLEQNLDDSSFEAKVDFVDYEGEPHDFTIRKIGPDIYQVPESEDTINAEDMLAGWCMLISGKQLSWRACIKYLETINVYVPAS